MTTSVFLNNDRTMPLLGLGLYKTTDAVEAEDAIAAAVQNGYRLLDTASAYKNEEFVGCGIAKCGVPRKDLFITTKIWNNAQRLGDVEGAFQRSLDRLGLDYIDLYLIHWPADGWQQAWDDLQEIYASGRAKAIGVSNFQKHHIDELLTHSDVVPAVDQVESSPQFTNQELIGQLRAKGIHTEAWSPLGGTGGNLLSNPVLAGIGAKYGRSAAQVVIRWHIQRGIVVLPKSTHAERIKQNFEVFDFNLSVDDMTAISAINTGTKTFTVSAGGTGFLANNLVLGMNFGVAANNGIFTVAPSSS